MNIVLRSSLTRALDNAFKNMLCSQVWLGHGDALFIGFGNEVLPPSASGKPHPIPTYELQTFYADWFIESGRNFSEDIVYTRCQPTEAASIVVGVHVVGWKFGASLAELVISFENNVVLRLTGWQSVELSTEEESIDAWVLRLPGGTHFAVSCAGVITFDGEADMQNTADSKGAGA